MIAGLAVFLAFLVGLWLGLDVAERRYDQEAHDAAYAEGYEVAQRRLLHKDGPSA